MWTLMSAWLRPHEFKSAGSIWKTCIGLSVWITSISLVGRLGTFQGCGLGLERSHGQLNVSLAFLEFTWSWTGTWKN